MSADTKFIFAAVDSHGAPRTGRIRAESAALAKEKLLRKGFTAIDIGEHEPSLQRPPREARFKVAAASRQGYKATWQDRTESWTSSTGPSGVLRRTAMAALGLGVLSLIWFWQPLQSKPELPNVSPDVTVQVSVKAQLLGSASVDAVVIDFPQIPYSWERPSRELLDDQKVLRAQIDIRTRIQPTLVKISLLKAGSVEPLLSKEQALAEGQANLDFGVLEFDSLP